MYGVRRRSYKSFVCCFQAADVIRGLVRSRGLGDVYKRQPLVRLGHGLAIEHLEHSLIHPSDHDVLRLPPPRLLEVRALHHPVSQTDAAAGDLRILPGVRYDLHRAQEDPLEIESMLFEDAGDAVEAVQLLDLPPEGMRRSPMP